VVSLVQAVYPTLQPRSDIWHQTVHGSLFGRICIMVINCPNAIVVCEIKDTIIYLFQLFLLYVVTKTSALGAKVKKMLTKLTKNC